MLFILILAIAAVWLIGQIFIGIGFWMIVAILAVSAAVWAIAWATGHRIRILDDIVPVVTTSAAIFAGIYVGSKAGVILGIFAALAVIAFGGAIIQGFKNPNQ